METLSIRQRMTSLLPEFKYRENLGLFIGCASAMIAAHTAFWVAEEKRQNPFSTNIFHPNLWLDSFGKSVVYDTVLLTSALGAYSYYQNHKKLGT